MIQLHHAPGSRSCRVRWILEELGIEYELISMQFTPESLRNPAYLEKNPNARVPTIVDGDVVVWESGAIVEYLLERYGEGRLQPAPGTPEWVAYLQWFHWSEATALPPLSDIVQHSMLRPEATRIAAVVPDAVARAASCLEVVEAALAGKSTITGGDFSAADIMLGYTLKLAKLIGQLGQAYPNANAYLEALEKRPAFEKAFGA